MAFFLIFFCGLTFNGPHVTQRFSTSSLGGPVRTNGTKVKGSLRTSADKGLNGMNNMMCQKPVEFVDWEVN